MLFNAGGVESIGDLSPVHLILTVCGWTLWFCLQSAQEELPETVYNGRDSVMLHFSMSSQVIFNDK